MKFEKGPLPEGELLWCEQQGELFIEARKISATATLRQLSGTTFPYKVTYVALGCTVPAPDMEDDVVHWASMPLPDWEDQVQRTHDIAKLMTATRRKVRVA